MTPRDELAALLAYSRMLPPVPWGEPAAAWLERHGVQVLALIDAAAAPTRVPEGADPRSYLDATAAVDKAVDPLVTPPSVPSQPEGEHMSAAHFDTSENFHPYECAGIGKCRHCDRRVIDGKHDPAACALCDPEYDGGPRSWGHRIRLLVGRETALLPACSRLGCTDLCVFATGYSYASSRGRPSTSSESRVCRRHGVAFAKKNGLDIPVVPTEWNPVPPPCVPPASGVEELRGAAG